MFKRHKQYFSRFIYRENPSSILKTTFIDGYFLSNFWFLLLLFPLSDRLASNFTKEREATGRKFPPLLQGSISLLPCFWTHVLAFPLLLWMGCPFCCISLTPPFMDK